MYRLAQDLGGELEDAGGSSCTRIYHYWIPELNYWIIAEAQQIHSGTWIEASGMLQVVWWTLGYSCPFHAMGGWGQAVPEGWGQDLAKEANSHPGTEEKGIPHSAVSGSITRAPWKGGTMEEMRNGKKAWLDLAENLGKKKAKRKCWGSFLCLWTLGFEKRWGKS